MSVQEAVKNVWLDHYHYHQLTGNKGAPHYDEGGSLFHWIVEHERDHQTHILEMCYIAGFRAGVSKIETQTVTLERARAVLSEVVSPMERKIDPASWQARYFIEKDVPHLFLLLHVVDKLLRDCITEQNNIIAGKQQNHREEPSI